MRKACFFLVVLFLPLSALASLGDLTILKRKSFTFRNNNCKKNDSCTLKSINYIVEDYGIEMLTGFNFGTRLFAEYETDKVEDLEDYVFVQFIRGCAFDSIKENGRIKTTATYILGNGRDFKYEWALDSDDDDPAYISEPEGRHNLYRWNKIPNSFDKKTEIFFYKEKPTTPKLYVTDRPGTAFVGNMWTKNLSLQLKMCLYRSADVHYSGELGKPIYCYQWSSSWIYDHNNDKYKNPGGISKVCKN